MWLVFIFFNTCSTQKAESITLISFHSDFLEINGTRPSGWYEVKPGTFRRTPESLDLTLLIHESFPGISVETLITSTLCPILDIDELPPPTDSVQTSLFLWRLYRIESDSFPDNLILDLGLTEGENTAYVIALFTYEEEYSELHKQVFLRAVDVLETTSGTRAISSKDIYTENLSVFDYDPSQPLSIQKTNEIHHDHFSEIALSYESPKGGRVPAILLVPYGPGPFPGMLIMHGLPGSKENMLPVAMRYAHAGAVTILIDAPFTRPGNINRPEGPITFTEKDREEQVQLIVDLRRAIDLLVNRDDVDPLQLAYTGASFGGAMGGLFSGVETRLKAYVLQVGDGGLVTHYTGLNDIFEYRFFQLSPEQQQSWISGMWPIEPIHFVAEASPAALLFQSGTDDLAVPPADAFLYQFVGSEPKKIIWYESGHFLPDQAILDQAQWLKQYINIHLEKFQ